MLRKRRWDRLKQQKEKKKFKKEDSEQKGWEAGVILKKGKGVKKMESLQPL